MSDLIRREDATKAVESSIKDGWGRISPIDACQNIRCLPSADRPQGKWQEVYAETDYNNGWIEFTCECCGHQHGLESGEYGWSYGDPIPWEFCPLCGARMKGADDE